MRIDSNVHVTGDGERLVKAYREAAAADPELRARLAELAARLADGGGEGA